MAKPTHEKYFLQILLQYVPIALCVSTFMHLAFIVAKESNDNNSLKGKKQSIRNSLSSVLQPFEMLYKSCVLFRFVKNHSEL